MYEYKAKVIKVYDGDTITCEIDLGFEISFTKSIRLARINTPEIRGDEREQGLISKERVVELILDKDVIIKTDKDSQGKYGRYIGDIYINDDLGAICLNDLLVLENLAVYHDY